MKNILIIFFTIILVVKINAQTNMNIDEKNDEVKKRILRSYINAGYGQSLNDKNFAIGAGWFFPLDKNILIGPRANLNIEKDALGFKSPVEQIWDVDLVIKYVPFLYKSFIISVGGGVGYGKALKRGKFIRYNLLNSEYEKEYSSFISLLGELEMGLLITNNFGLNVVLYTLNADKKTLLNLQIGLFLCKINELN